MKSLTFRLTAILLLSLLGAGRARAELVQYSYQWSATPGVLVGTNPDAGNINGVSTGSIALAVEPDGKTSSMAGGGPTTLPGATFFPSTSAAGHMPDLYSAKAFSLTLKLTEELSGKYGELTFTGLVDGTLSTEKADLVAMFKSPTKQELQLGGYTFWVSVPGKIEFPMNGGQANVDAQLQVTKTLSQVPEPGTLVLVGVALPMTLVGLRFNKLRRRGAVG